MAKIKTEEFLGVEPGTILTSIVDQLAIKPTKEEVKELKAFGFEPNKAGTHFSDEENTIVKFVVRNPMQKLTAKTLTFDTYFMRVELDDYDFSLFRNFSF